MARTPAARFRGRLAFLALSALTGSASAGITLSSFPPNPGVLPGGGWQFTSGTTFADPTPPRAWVNGVYGGVPSATAVDSLTLSGRAGALAVTARTTVTAAEVALALVRVAGGVGTALAVGSLAYDFLQSVGVRQGPSGALIDPGSDPVQTSVLEYAVGNGTFVSPLAAACGAVAAFRTNPYDVWKFVSSRVGSGGDAYCTLTATDRVTGNIVDVREFSMTSRLNNSAKSCSPILDSSTGQMYVPGMFDDGKCMTGRYEAPSNPSQVAGRLESAVNGDVARGAKAAVSAGQQIPAQDFKPEGPASQIGQSTSTTTTTASGTTTTTTTPTYTYSYNGDKITYTTTTVTNTCTGAGSCSSNNADTTTTTTTGSPTPQDPADPCTADPSRLGCLKLGEPPDDKVPKNNKTVTFTPEVLGLGGSCPAPVQLPHGQQISYQTVCDGVVQARPLIIAMGFLMAGGIMLGALRPQ